jgi:hypothetical protein
MAKNWPFSPSIAARPMPVQRDLRPPANRAHTKAARLFRQFLDAAAENRGGIGRKIARSSRAPSLVDRPVGVARLRQRANGRRGGVPLGIKTASLRRLGVTVRNNALGVSFGANRFSRRGFVQARSAAIRQTSAPPPESKCGQAVIREGLSGTRFTRFERRCSPSVFSVEAGLRGPPAALRNAGVLPTIPLLRREARADGQPVFRANRPVTPRFYSGRFAVPPPVRHAPRLHTRKPSWTKLGSTRVLRSAPPCSARIMSRRQ